MIIILVIAWELARQMWKHGSLVSYWYVFELQLHWMHSCAVSA
jgi:hypothetical protein